MSAVKRKSIRLNVAMRSDIIRQYVADTIDPKVNQQGAKLLKLARVAREKLLPKGFTEASTAHPEWFPTCGSISLYYGKGWSDYIEVSLPHEEYAPLPYQWYASSRNHRELFDITKGWGKTLYEAHQKLKAMHARRLQIRRDLENRLDLIGSTKILIESCPELEKYVPIQNTPTAAVAVPMNDIVQQVKDFPDERKSAPNEKGAGKALREAKKNQLPF